MVRIVIEMPGGSCKEFAIIELQGDLETRHPVPLMGKFIGDLHFTDKDVPVLIIGHHILHGKMVYLEKPLAVITKATGSSISDCSPDQDQMDTQHEGETFDSKPGQCRQYAVQAVIRKKLIFKTRPKPIIAHVPKKV